MTRKAKLEAVESKFKTLIENSKQEIEVAQKDLRKKEESFDKIKIDYDSLVSAVNEYYDALDMIAKLQAIKEPEV